MDHGWSTARVVATLVGMLMLAAAPADAASSPELQGGESVRFGLRAERGMLERVGGARFRLTLHELHPRAVRLTDRPRRSDRGRPAKRLLAGWSERGFAGDRPHALLAVTSGKRKERALAVELATARLVDRGRGVRFRARPVDAASSPVPDVERRLAPGRFAGASLLIYTKPRAAASRACGYVGQVDLFAARSQPGAYLTADGQQLRIADYLAVYALIGRRFGGDGSQVFNLPDVSAPPGLQYRFCVAGTFPPQAWPPAGCAGGEISLQAQTFVPAGWERTDIAASPGLAYYRCAGDQPARECFIGQLGLFASGSLPASYLPADGRALRIASNQPLYFVLGTTFGGDDDTFNLPNLPGPIPGTSYGVCADGLWPS
jgi:microcystin-dependent protein